MTSQNEQVFTEALSLPPNERAELAERLFSSLDFSSQRIDQLWAREAESRIEAFERREIKAVPAGEVFKKIEADKNSESIIS